MWAAATHRQVPCLALCSSHLDAKVPHRCRGRCTQMRQVGPTPRWGTMGAHRLRRQRLDDPHCHRLEGARGVGRTQWPLLWSTSPLLFPYWAIRAATASTSTTGAGDNCSSNCSHLICESSTQSSETDWPRGSAQQRHPITITTERTPTETGEFAN